MRALIATVLFLAAGVIGNDARGDIFFSDFGAGDSFNTTGGWTITNAGSGFNYYLTPGESFVAAVTGKLGQIDMALAVLGGSGTLFVDLRQDKRGTPGAIVESFTITAPIRMLGELPAIATVQSTLNPVLQAGTRYWITFRPAAPGLFAVSYFNSIGQTGLHSSQVVAGGSFLVATQTQGTFRLQTLGGSRAVPEPPALVLVIAGGLILWRSRPGFARRKPAQAG